MSKPTDAELDSIDMDAKAIANQNPIGTPFAWRKAYLTALARAVLARWGQPAHSGEPFAWHVCSVNSDGSLSLEHAAAWEEAAHEHIKDAITEHDIEGAGSWVVRPAYHAPQPSPTAQAADSVQEDAARYRWLREGNDAKHGAAWHVAVNLYGCEWDAAIDAAMNKGATP